MIRNPSRIPALVLACSMSLFSATACAWQLMTVEAAEVANKIKIGGTIIPFKEVTLSAQIPGRIQYIAGSEGDFFKKGSLLVAINDDDLMAKRRAALAQLANAEANLGNAQVQYNRELISPRSKSPSTMPGMGMPTLFDNLFTRNAGDWMGYGDPSVERHAELYSSVSQVKQAEAAVLRARSMLEEIDAKLRDARAIAPFDGQLVRKMVEVGDTVQPGTPLVRFALTQYLRIQAEVPARLIIGLAKGQYVDVKLDIGDVYTKARVAQIYPVADSKKHTVTVKFDLPEGTPGGPGLYAEVTIKDVTSSRKPMPVIPKNAIIRRGSLPSVYILDENDRAQMRLVRLGIDYDKDRVTVLSGINPGDRIISEPPKNIRSGWSPNDDDRESRGEDEESKS